jgi:hypothetical protein
VIKSDKTMKNRHFIIALAKSLRGFFLKVFFFIKESPENMLNIVRLFTICQTTGNSILNIGSHFIG